MLDKHQLSGRSQRKINVEKPIPDRAIIMPWIEVIFISYEAMTFTFPSLRDI